MLIIWKGFGIFVLIIAALCLFIAEFIGDMVTNNPNFYQTHHWLPCLALFMAAVPVHFMGRHLNQRLGRGDALFFIRVEYWAIILPVLGLCYLFAHIAQN